MFLLLNSSILSSKINVPEKGGGEDYFNDLANETSFYEGEDNISHEEHKITGLIDLENEVPFEILTELNWDLTEENSESKSCIRSDKVAYNRKDPTPCSSNGQETQYSVNPSQKLQWSLEKRDKVSPVTTSTAKTASPKAKSRCHKIESTLTQENENTSNDWLQDISLDCFGFSSSHAHENMGSKQSLSLSSKVRVKECEMVSPLEKSSSQCKKTSDDFDDLAEEW